MRNRNIQIIVCLNRDENQHLKKLVKRSGLTQSTYLRHLISGVVPQDAPPPDYYGMMAELRNIGVSLNQIAQVANAFGFIDAAKYDEAIGQLNRAVVKISEAVLLPRKCE